MNHDGTEKTKEECPGFVCCITTVSAMSMMDYMTGTRYAVDKDAMEWEQVSR